MPDLTNIETCGKANFPTVEDMVQSRYFLVRRVQQKTSLKLPQSMSSHREKSDIAVRQISLQEREAANSDSLPETQSMSEPVSAYTTSESEMINDEPDSDKVNFDGNKKDSKEVKMTTSNKAEGPTVIDQTGSFEVETPILSDSSHSHTPSISPNSYLEETECNQSASISRGITEVETIITSDDDSMMNDVSLSSAHTSNEHEVISIESDDEVEVVDVVKAPKNRLKEKRKRAQTRNQQQYLDFFATSERFELPTPKLQMKFRPKPQTKSRQRAHSFSSCKLRYADNGSESNKRPRSVSVGHEKSSSYEKECRADISSPTSTQLSAKNDGERVQGNFSQDSNLRTEPSGEECSSSPAKEKHIPHKVPTCEEASGSVQNETGHDIHSNKFRVFMKKNNIGRTPFSTKKHYNYSNTKEDAFLEQERLFREAASRVRSHTKVFVIQQHNDRVFSAPVTDISKLPDSHWTYKDPYSRLGLPENSNTDLVKKQFRRLALLYHPDKAKGFDAADRFQAIKEAYENITSRTN